jgi:hypothetical protein
MLKKVQIPKIIEQSALIILLENELNSMSDRLEMLQERLEVLEAMAGQPVSMSPYLDNYTPSCICDSDYTGLPHKRHCPFAGAHKLSLIHI